MKCQQFSVDANSNLQMGKISFVVFIFTEVMCTRILKCQVVPSFVRKTVVFPEATTFGSCGRFV